MSQRVTPTLLAIISPLFIESSNSSTITKNSWFWLSFSNMHLISVTKCCLKYTLWLIGKYFETYLMLIVWHFNRINFIRILFLISNWLVSDFLTEKSARNLKTPLIEIDQNNDSLSNKKGINLKSNLGHFFDHVMCFFRKSINRNSHFQISLVLEINWSTQLRW